MPGVRLTLSNDATPSEPTILITQSADGGVNVNVLGVVESQGLAVVELLRQIADGLESVLQAPQEGAHGTHLDAENFSPAEEGFVPTSEQAARRPERPIRPKFAPR